MILFRMDGRGLDDTSSVIVTEYFVIVAYEGIYWDLEGFSEKEYSGEKLWPHQEYYNRFKNDQDKRPVIDFLIKSNLITENTYLYMEKVSAKTALFNLLSAFTENKNIINQLWNSVRDEYSNASRHYHSLSHIRTLLASLDYFGKSVEDLDVTKFAIFYHDIVYDVVRNDNEEQSAAWAERVMQSLNIESNRIERCKRHILATKDHNKSDDFDTNLFTDADLSILGSEPEIYSQYASAIRQEYSIFPVNLYNEGRVTVLKKLLERPMIFHTTAFQNLYEDNARHNLSREIEMLKL